VGKWGKGKGGRAEGGNEGEKGGSRKKGGNVRGGKTGVSDRWAQQCPNVGGEGALTFRGKSWRIKNRKKVGELIWGSRGEGGLRD